MICGSVDNLDPILAVIDVLCERRIILLGAHVCKSHRVDPTVAVVRCCAGAVCVGQIPHDKRVLPGADIHTAQGYIFPEGSRSMSRS